MISRQGCLAGFREQAPCGGAAKTAHRGGYSEDTRTLRQFAASWQPRDKTASLPQLDIVAVHDPVCLLDGILIITVFDIFGAPNVTVVGDGVDAIFRHAATPEFT
jgi:hypothetical protein